MSIQICRHSIEGDSPGRSTELTYFRIGPPSAAKKVFLQAALHADEHPGILILSHLLEMLKAADANDALAAEFVVFPMVNPLAMGDIEFGKHQGRYERSSGVNHNRQWPRLYDWLPADIGDRLGPVEADNVKLVRRLLLDALEAGPRETASAQWRYLVMREACDADYVFDLHCDDEALIHIYSIPQNRQRIQGLSDRLGAAATLLAEDSGGGSFDEVWPSPWLRLAREYPQKPVGLPVLGCTIEFRGEFDTFDSLNLQDARNLYAFFQDENLIAGASEPVEKAAPEASDFRATQLLRAPAAGLLIFRVSVGDSVEAGDRIADLLCLDGEGAYADKTALLAETSGFVLSRRLTKYVWRNAMVAKIVGRDILESRTGNLLSD